jgi:Short C-terminal domain
MGFRRRARRRGMIAGAAIGAAAARHRDSNEPEQPQADQAPTEEYGTAAAPPPASPADELERVAKLHASGVLTDEEFAAAKAKIIGPA